LESLGLKFAILPGTALKLRLKNANSLNNENKRSKTVSHSLSEASRDVSYEVEKVSFG
jgi:hypothetical protein